MTTIYYLSSIIIIISQMDWLLSPIKMTADAKKFREMSKLNENKKWDDYPDEYKSEVKSRIRYLFTPLWLFIGLFTFQWIAFLFILVFNFLVVLPLSKLTRFSTIYIMLHWFNSLIGLLFCLFVIVNHFHLKIDLTQWVLSLIK
jgi:hypothetical protein